ncbi:hypothetical protein OG196_43430 (plasmid) [Kitasatospora purpeofusca]|uniref:hypothetical protein n=1 Tax=Kitasatospora purpeofusca TaxID=67352 RepID=UPI002E1481AC|nr:hypothetical protein OG196_43430 [Kitasatospora purpeofusca]
MPTHTPTTAEQYLIAHLRAAVCPDDRPAVRVVLSQGRLFTPRPWPASGAPRRGTPTRCFTNALRIAHRVGGAYVEGYVLTDGGIRRHAWSTDTHGAVLDPTHPRNEAAQAYLGVPIAPWFVNAFQQRTLTKTHFVGVLDTRVQTERDADRIHNNGIPPLALLDIGTAMPSPTGPCPGQAQHRPRHTTCAGRNTCVASPTQAKA